MSRPETKPGPTTPEERLKPQIADTQRDATDSHAMTVGAGAAGGGIAGAAVGAASGAIAGPIGAAAGAAVGAILGGIAGKQIAESFTEEDIYFREHFSSRHYAAPERKYEDYQPAYRFGWEAGERFEGTHFEEIEPELQRGWTTAKPSIPWEEARLAARDAWDRRRQRLLDAANQPSEDAEKRVDPNQALVRDDS
jgi:hypothetical protein